MSMNLLYSQIGKIEKYLQENAKAKKFGFLKSSIFDQYFISKLCFDPVVKDSLVKNSEVLIIIENFLPL